MDESEWLSREGSVNQIEKETRKNRRKKNETKGWRNEEGGKKRCEMVSERCCLRVDIISNLYFLVICLSLYLSLSVYMIR